MPALSAHVLVDFHSSANGLVPVPEPIVFQSWLSSLYPCSMTSFYDVFGCLQPCDS